jgi:hypothetical protein
MKVCSFEQQPKISRAQLGKLFGAKQCGDPFENGIRVA